ncbi:MAB_1171c family putative transporter [Streptomyces sp. NPDC048290]|uniref:MAB_1171c family putative transporter n=1 Tax=Streptomyces sp. NPDC048290 TaxID=3155811 RepID=UPI00342C11B4
MDQPAARMSDGLAYGPALVAMGVGWYELRLSRGPRAGRSVRLLCLFGVLLGAAMAVLAPATMAAADHVWPGLSPLAHLLGRELEMTALAFLPLVVIELDLPPRWRARRRTHLTVTAIALPLCAGLFLAAGPDINDGKLSADGLGWILLALFGAIFTSYGLWCLVVFALPVLDHARGLPSGPLRTGLLLIGAGAAIGLVWGAWGVTGIRNMVVTHQQGAAQDPVAVALGTGCLAVAALGATAARWSGALDGLRRRLRARRDHHALEGLWAALHTVLPETALPVHPWPGGGRPVRRGRGLRGRVGLRDVEFALYRRVVEIRDGYLALRPHVPAELPDWTRTALDYFPPPRPAVAAVTEAAAVAAAIEAATAGHRHREAGTAAPPCATGPLVPASAPAGGGTVDAEAAWLTQVAEAFTTSVAVEHVRHRARKRFAGTRETRETRELSAGGGAGSVGEGVRA